MELILASIKIAFPGKVKTAMQGTQDLNVENEKREIGGVLEAMDD